MSDEIKDKIVPAGKVHTREDMVREYEEFLLREKARAKLAVEKKQKEENQKGDKKYKAKTANISKRF
jgi:hypothetical protein